MSLGVIGLINSSAYLGMEIRRILLEETHRILGTRNKQYHRHISCDFIQIQTVILKCELAR